MRVRTLRCEAINWWKIVWKLHNPCFSIIQLSQGDQCQLQWAPILLSWLKSLINRLENRLRGSPPMQVLLTKIDLGTFVTCGWAKKCKIQFFWFCNTKNPRQINLWVQIKLKFATFFKERLRYYTHCPKLNIYDWRKNKQISFVFDV